MKVIVVANQKGGVGKTSTATNLAYLLNKTNKKTLLIDADQQGNSTDTYQGKIEGEATLFDVILEDDRISLSEAIQETEYGDIVASDPLLRRADEILKNDVEGIYRLSDSMESIKNKYDYVIIDTAPAINSILHSCLIAADYVILPATPDRYGLQGLSQITETISAIKRRQNRNLKIAGILLVKYHNRAKLDREIKDNLEKIAEKIGTQLLDVYIRESTKTRESQAMRMPVCAYDKKCTTSQDYEELVKYIVEEL